MLSNSDISTKKPKKKLYFPTEKLPATSTTTILLGFIIPCVRYKMVFKKLFREYFWWREEKERKTNFHRMMVYEKITEAGKLSMK